MSHLSLTTWSLHRELGPLQWTYWDDVEKTQKTRIEKQPENITLLDLPSILAKQQFHSFEVGHFHFPSTDESYLLNLKEECLKAGISFHCLLIDYGDISHLDFERRNSDIEFIKRWVDVAAIVGAKSVRVIAGEANPLDHAALERSKGSFQQIISYAEPKGVRIVTENFKSLSSTKENCLELIKTFDGKLGLTVDFGNFSKEKKYESIKDLVMFAESIHAKANYDQAGKIEKEELRASLNIVANSEYNGPITLVYDGPGHMWEGIEQVKAVAKPFCE